MALCGVVSEGWRGCACETGATYAAERTAWLRHGASWWLTEGVSILVRYTKENGGSTMWHKFQPRGRLLLPYSPILQVEIKTRGPTSRRALFCLLFLQRTWAFKTIDRLLRLICTIAFVATISRAFLLLYAYGLVFTRGHAEMLFRNKRLNLSRS